MKYTRFGKRDRARLEEFARLREEFARLREERARLSEELVRFRKEHAGPGEEHARLREYTRLSEEGARLREEDARLGEEVTRWSEERAWSEHARPMRFLLAIAVQLLPPSERDRYLEEFRAELLDIPGNTRPSHALSLLRGVFVLRLRLGLKKEATDAAVRRAKGSP